ncbi:MAG: ferritin family protein [Candidatus Margulisbacteria bacterium]|jgi:rubrerythrin|nr:ferritin family protein [Candidatus Margulisiibacteriota bacterium]
MDIKADVKFSIELEKKGYAFYRDTAARTKNPLAASTLSSLAEREQVHIERIMEYYLSLTGEQILRSDWLKEVAVPPTRAQLLKPILLKLKSLLSKKIETTAEINEAYEIAEGLERDSFTLYDQISKKSADPTAQKFYASLAQEEREHYAILDETLQYLNSPGDWFRKEERWIVEG